MEGKTQRIVVLVEGPYEHLQAEMPEYEFLSRGTDPAKLVGREVRVLVDRPGKPAPPRSIKDVILEYSKDRHFVAVSDVIENVLGIALWPYRSSYEKRIAAVLKDMGWTKASLRRGPYRMNAYLPPPTVPRARSATPAPSRSLMQNRPRGANR